MDTTQSIFPAASACVCTSANSFSRVPFSAQRLNRLWIEFHFPNRRDRLRRAHKAGVQPTQNLPKRCRPALGYWLVQAAEPKPRAWYIDGGYHTSLSTNRQACATTLGQRMAPVRLPHEQR